MQIYKIVEHVNRQMDDEMYVWFDIEYIAQKVLDEINDRLSSNFPEIEGFGEDEGADYNFFPNRWIRGVLIPGIIYELLVVQDEFENLSFQRLREKQEGLEKMFRDYTVPEEYQLDGDIGVMFVENDDLVMDNQSNYYYEDRSDVTVFTVNGGVNYGKDK